MYGERRRLVYFLEAIARLSPSAAPRIIELGCGTGEGLLSPLAAALPSAKEIVGVDFDATSIATAQKLLGERPFIPLRFVLSEAERLPNDFEAGAWDVVILSEVIEHVENPFPLLETANRLLRPGGLLLVTIPNGYGPFEIENFFWDGLKLERKIRSLRAILGRKSAATPSTMADTNRHVGFYAWGNVKKLLSEGGFDIRESRNREWFCGPFTDLLHGMMKRVGAGGLLVALTQGFAGVLPRFAAADWMAAAVKTGTPSSYRFPVPSSGLSGWWWRVKRRQSGR